MDPVKIEQGYVSGTVLGEPGQEVRVFRGIPYAAPPVGELRWKPPQPAAHWPGIRECTVFSQQAAQFVDINMPPEAQRMPMSEDCLYLNVLTTAKTMTDRLPVMVWFHGGGLRYGSGNSPLYNGPGLPRHGVVLVTVNSRLGVLGQLAHPLLSRESPKGVSGNYMFLDLIAALQWVQRNITAFGGDPGRVTIFGESGGGIKVIYLMSSPLARGLFHGAICESAGGHGPPPSLKDMEAFGEKLFARLAVDKEPDPLAAARALNWEKIIAAEQALNIELGPEYVFLGPWNAAVDNWFLPDVPAAIFQAGRQSATPFITVSNLGELTGPGSIVAPQQLLRYVGLLSGASRANVRGYAAIFDQVPANWRQEGGVASHAMEMHYVFGALDFTQGWKYLFRLYSAAGAKSPLPLITDMDRKVSEAVMTMWAQFARTGNPSVKGLVEWPPWEADTDRYLLIKEPLQVKSGYSRVAQK